MPWQVIIYELVLGFVYSAGGQEQADDTELGDSEEEINGNLSLP